MKNTSLDPTRRQTVQGWLRGPASKVVLMLPDEIDLPERFASCCGIAPERIEYLPDGELRPSFEPHPGVTEALADTEITDIVIVTCTSSRRFTGRGRRRHATNFLETQLERLSEYRRHPRLRHLADVQLHGWLWDCERGELLPMCQEVRDLHAERKVVLAPQELAPASGYGSYSSAATG